MPSCQGCCSRPSGDGLWLFWHSHFLTHYRYTAADFRLTYMRGSAHIEIAAPAQVAGVALREHQEAPLTLAANEHEAIIRATLSLPFLARKTFDSRRHCAV
jgi:hypothetical protein